MVEMKHVFLGIVVGLMQVLPSSAEDIKFGNWNIQTLVHPSDTITVFLDDHVRKAADFADLRRWRDLVGADVYFLQEVTSPAAIDAVFPVADGWSHCVSGQYAELENLPDPGPVCSDSDSTPALPAASERQQFAGIAVRQPRALPSPPSPTTKH